MEQHDSKAGVNTSAASGGGIPAQRAMELAEVIEGLDRRSRQWTEQSAGAFGGV